MRGIIIKFDEDTGQGLISGDDNNRYHFDVKDWSEIRLPQEEQGVDFDSNDGKNAIDIFALDKKKKNLKPQIFMLFGLSFWLLTLGQKQGWIPDFSTQENGFFKQSLAVFACMFFALAVPIYRYEKAEKAHKEKREETVGKQEG